MAGKDLIRYDLLVQDALKGVVRKILSDAARDGLAGDHHFYVSFRTDFPGVRLSNRMREKWPQAITIVLQHQFWDLTITEHAFDVGLSFNGVPERLHVPFEALTGFFDPSVQFGLKFEIKGDEADATADASPAPVLPPAQATKGAGSEPVELQPKKAVPAMPAPAEPVVEPEDIPEAPAAEIVSLDAFRKKS